MANNRMYLKCRGCGATFLLGSCMVTPYTVGSYRKDFKESLNNFYEEHYLCSKDRSVCAENQFTLCYEELSESNIMVESL